MFRLLKLSLRLVSKWSNNLHIINSSLFILISRWREMQFVPMKLCWNYLQRLNKKESAGWLSWFCNQTNLIQANKINSRISSCRCNLCNFPFIWRARDRLLRLNAELKMLKENNEYLCSIRRWTWSDLIKIGLTCEIAVKANNIRHDQTLSVALWMVFI